MIVDRLTRALLAVDAAVNVALGVLLLVFPRGVIRALGAPDADPAFYPSVLGGVLVGIGVALWLERRRAGGGLAIRGAIAINLCGAGTLAAWLLFGGLDLATQGRAILWSIAAVVAGIGVIEWRGVARHAGTKEET